MLYFLQNVQSISWPTIFTDLTFLQLFSSVNSQPKGVYPPGHTMQAPPQCRPLKRWTPTALYAILHEF